jgi:hypothetical protein
VTLALLACALPASAVTPSTYTTTKLFGIDYAGNQQGLAYADGHHYVGFDEKDSVARAIIQYGATGTLEKKSPALAIGHAAEIGYRTADGNLYVATGGSGNPTKIAVVDMRPTTPTITKTYSFSALNGDGMVAIDNADDRMVVFGGESATTHQIALAGFDGTIASQFGVPDLGTPNGLEVLGDQILYLTTHDKTRNVVTAFSPTGTLQYCEPLTVVGEGEGLAADPRTRTLYLGLRSPRSVNKVSPAWSGQPLDGSVLVNGHADCGASGEENADAVPIPAWKVTGGMSTIGYAVGGGYPTTSSPGPANRGAVFFTGGTAATATMTQTVSLTAQAAGIDAGQQRYSLDGWLGGYKAQTDTAKVVVTFKDAAGTALGTTQIGPVTHTDRHDVTGLLERTTTGAVPKGARSASVVVTASRDSGTNNDGYADSLSLVLTRA